MFVAREGEAYALTAEKEYLVDYTLTELETRLGSDFAHASRADLVGVAHIEKFVSETDGRARLLLRDGVEIRVSRRRTAEVKRRLEQLA